MNNLHTMYSSRTSTRIKYANLLKYNMPVYLLAFIMGRAVILNGLIPFGLAFFAAVLINNKNLRLAGLFTIIGYITVYKQTAIVRYLLSIILFYIFYSIICKKDGNNKFKVAVIGFLSNFVSGWIYILRTGFLLYDVMLVLCESAIIFLMVYILSTGLSFIFENKKRNIISNEEMISISIIFSISITGIFDYYIWGYSVKNIFSLLVVLIFAYLGGSGTGASIAITVALILTLSSDAPAYIIGILGFCGMLSGLMRRLGRIGIIFSFLIANVVLAFCISRTTGIYFRFGELIAASSLFILVPGKILDNIRSYIDKTAYKAREQKEYGFKLKEIAISRLNEFSEVFKELSATFSHIEQSSRILDKQKITELFSMLAEKTCDNCPLYKSCWDKDFYATYQNMFEMLATLESEGSVNIDRIPQNIRKKCLRLERIINEINNVYEIYKINYKWQKKIDESRNLISCQLKGISQVVERLASELDVDIKFNSDIEDDIHVALDLVGIHVEDVVVVENNEKRFEVDIVTKHIMSLEQIKKAERIISDIMGRNYLSLPKTCIRQNKSRCYLRLIESENYQVTVGVASVTKDNEKISGDSHSFMPIKGGNYLLAISDGMGSGIKAHEESVHTISLIEQFLKAGFEKRIAIKTINSVLILRKKDEIFSTGDICIIDLFNGNIEFLKIGAAASYIKRKNSVQMIKSDTLPIGILNDIDVKLNRTKVKHGDYIIMVTDGVIESALEQENKEDWLLHQIQCMETKNPQEMAETLLDIAKKNYDGVIKDDITVLVARIWRNV
ncbi:MAG: stage II sporulation protein E [Clostridia bacterium]|nr:stage II sporulation protein E [Clostridia bacterium]